MRKSEQINELVLALSKARAKFKPVHKKSENPYFKSKYADLAEIIDCTKDGLSENGLVVIQSPGSYSPESGMVTLSTTIAHSSGQWLEDDFNIPVGKQDAQGVGSAITYGRRYAYGAALNVASEQDDDGNAAVGKKGASQPKAKVIKGIIDEITDSGPDRTWLKIGKERVLITDAGDDSRLANAAGKEVELDCLERRSKEGKPYWELSRIVRVGQYDFSDADDLTEQFQASVEVLKEKKECVSPKVTF